MNQFVAFGQNGVIEKVQKISSSCLGDILDGQFLVDSTSMGTTLARAKEVILKSDTEEEVAKKAFTSVYERWGKFGPFGDVLVGMRLFEHGANNHYVTCIAQRYFPLAKLAADLVLFVSDPAGHLYFIGVVRGNEPGEGKAALIGGFRNVCGFHLDTPMETIFEETEQESGLIIIPVQVERESEQYKTDPNMSSVGVFVPRLNIRTRMDLVGIFVTGPEDELLHLGEKRVHETTAFVCVIPVEGELTPEALRGYFEAGDDAREIFICDVNEKGVPDFGISHHETIFREALKHTRTQ